MLHGDGFEGGADGGRDADEDALRRLTALRLKMLQDKMHAAQQEAAQVRHQMCRLWMRTLR